MPLRAYQDFVLSVDDVHRRGARYTAGERGIANDKSAIRQASSAIDESGRHHATRILEEEGVPMVKTAARGAN
jgi:hypothetical protein